MDPVTKRWLLVALVIAAIGLTACVVRTVPAHHHHEVRGEKHKPAKHKDKKHKDHGHGHDHH
jgi:hypothetical protein